MASIVSFKTLKCGLLLFCSLGYNEEHISLEISQNNHNDLWPNLIQLESADAAMPMEHLLHPAVGGVGEAVMEVSSINEC